jgi:hypothetical protein
VVNDDVERGGVVGGDVVGGAQIYILSIHLDR